MNLAARALALRRRHQAAIPARTARAKTGCRHTAPAAKTEWRVDPVHVRPGSHPPRNLDQLQGASEPLGDAPRSALASAALRSLARRVLHCLPRRRPLPGSTRGASVLVRRRPALVARTDSAGPDAHVMQKRTANMGASAAPESPCSCRSSSRMGVRCRRRTGPREDAVQAHMFAVCLCKIAELRSPIASSRLSFAREASVRPARKLTSRFTKQQAPRRLICGGPALLLRWDRLSEQQPYGPAPVCVTPGFGC